MSLPRPFNRFRAPAGAAVMAGLLWPSLAAGQELRLPDGQDALRERIEAALPEADEAETLIEARRTARETAGRVEQVLRSQGYYAGEIEARAEAGDPPRALIVVEPGPRFTFGDIAFDYSRPLHDPAIAARVEREPGIRAGAPALAETVLAAEGQAVARLREAGYPDARAGDRRAIVDHADREMDVTFRLQTGRPARYGDVVLCGDCPIRPGYFHSIRTFSEGEVYDPKDFQAFSDRIAATGAYRNVDIRLAEPQTGDGWATRDVVVEIEEGENQTIEAGASYSTSEGVGAEAVWSTRNVFGGAETLRLSVTAASLERALRAELDLPHFLEPWRTLTLGAGVEQDDTDAFDRKAAAIGAAIEQPITEYIAGSIGAELEASRVEDRQTGERDFVILTGFADARYDDTDDLLDPTEGLRASLRLEPSIGTGDESLLYARAIASVSAYRKLADAPRLVLAGRIRAGSILGASASDLPADQRFYAGGGGSVRGYQFQSVGPEDDEGNPLGGRSLIEASAELRARVTERWGAAAFIDAGTTERDEFPGLSDMQAGAGVGVRYHTDFGPIRGDVAFPLDGGDGVQIYISIGQAF